MQHGGGLGRGGVACEYWCGDLKWPAWSDDETCHHCCSAVSQQEEAKTSWKPNHRRDERFLLLCGCIPDSQSDERRQPQRSVYWWVWKERHVRWSSPKLPDCVSPEGSHLELPSAWWGHSNHTSNVHKTASNLVKNQVWNVALAQIWSFNKSLVSLNAPFMCWCCVIVWLYLASFLSNYFLNNPPFLTETMKK